MNAASSSHPSRCYCGPPGPGAAGTSPSTLGWCLWCSASSAKVKALEMLEKGEQLPDGSAAPSALGLWPFLSQPIAHATVTSTPQSPDTSPSSAQSRQLPGSCPLPDAPSTSLPWPRAPIFPEGTARTGCWKVYRQGPQLGQGAFGTVYRATKRGQGEEQYAIKMISKLKLTSAEEVEAVRREVHVLTVLQGHPRVVRLYEVYEDKYYVCLVLELCEGGDLHDVLAARGALPEAEAVHILRCIVELLQHCHSLGVLHRDLKPENLVLAGGSGASALSPLVKGIDFGHSLVLQEGQEEAVREVVGSVHYLAPECIAGRYSRESDLWSCGVILYCLLCGFPPFRGSTVQHVLDSIQQQQPALEGGAWGRVSAEAKDLVLHLLDRSPCSRATLDQVAAHPWMQPSFHAAAAQGDRAGSCTAQPTEVTAVEPVVQPPVRAALPQACCAHAGDCTTEVPHTPAVQPQRSGLSQALSAAAASCSLPYTPSKPNPSELLHTPTSKAQLTSSPSELRTSKAALTPNPSDLHTSKALPLSSPSELFTSKAPLTSSPCEVLHMATLFDRRLTGDLSAPSEVSEPEAEGDSDSERCSALDLGLGQGLSSEHVSGLLTLT